jgi:hypothetical protein
MVSLRTGHSKADTKPIILEALSDQLAYAHMRFLKFEKECKRFESQYGMDSESFLKKFDSGELGDELQWFDWYASLKGKEIWEKKYQILNEITWCE